MEKSQLLDLVDWTKVLAAKRYAGGHSEVMSAIFGDNAEVIASHVDDAYQGELAYAYQFKDGTVALVTDYFGSCSGCDSWEDATDEEAKNLITSIVTSARLCPSVKAAVEFCETVSERAEDFSHEEAKTLIEQLKARAN